MKFLKGIKSKSVLITLCVVGVIALVVTVGQRYRFTIIENGIQYITVPVQKGIDFVGGSFNNTLAKFQDISVLQEKNNNLEQEINKLSYDNNILIQYEAENEKLKQLLELANRYKKYPNEGANVISKDPGNWYKIFTIDKGTDDGFDKDDTILSGSGLVGHIIEAGPLSSKVMAIIDDRNAVSATVFRTGDIGVLKGDIELIQEGFCKLQIDIQSEVIKGDQIVTSHLSDIYPPGITIGIVEEIIIAQNGLTQFAYVRPLVDFEHLQQVLVLKTND